MNRCNLCNIDIPIKNYSRHCKSNTHVDKEERKLKCERCNSTYKNIQSYKTHMNEYHKHRHKKKKPIISNEEETDVVDNINKNVIIVKDQVINTKKDIKKIEKKVDTALIKASSIINFLMDKFSDANLLLTKINENNYSDTLRLDYKYDNKTFANEEDNYNDFDYKLEMILVNDYKRNLFITNITKTILNYVDHKNPYKQPVYSTDVNRCNYVIKINTKWNHDVNGNKFKEYVIIPILNTIEKMINKYIKDNLERIDIRNMNNNELTSHYEWLGLTHTFQNKLHNNDFIKPLLKELSSYLKFIEDDLIDIKKDDYDDIYEFTIHDNINRINKKLI